MTNILFTVLPTICILFIATYTDIKCKIISNKLIAVGFGYFIIYQLFWLNTSIGFSLLGVLAATGILYLFALFNSGSVGGGDIKLMALLGFIYGWEFSILLLLCTLFLAFFWALCTRKLNENGFLPMAPFICTAFLIMQLIIFY